MSGSILSCAECRQWSYIVWHCYYVLICSLNFKLGGFGIIMCLSTSPSLCYVDNQLHSYMTICRRDSNSTKVTGTSVFGLKRLEPP